MNPDKRRWKRDNHKDTTGAKNLQETLSASLVRSFSVSPCLRGFVLYLCSSVFICGSLVSSASAETWKAGAAKIEITPEKPLWMAGYGARTAPAEGTQQPLWAKALVLEDPTGQRAVLVTMDLVGIDRDLSTRVCDQLASKYGLSRAQIALDCSHTHCGPVVGRNLKPMYFLDDAMWTMIHEYTDSLEQKLVAVVGQAIDKLAPSTISWGQGYCGFAVNRRTNVQLKVPELRQQGLLVGPSDHDVPVLAVRDPAGKFTAVVFGYACHATVLAFNKFCGDYPGYAQAALEKDHPGAIALFWAGCGADQNPLPRQTVELAESYGRRLATAVDEVLDTAMTPITGALATQYAEIPLPLDTLPTREELNKDATDSNRYIASRAKMLLAQIDAGKPLSQTYPYPVQVWRLGSGPLWITLGGEVVVDYSLRLKRELGQSTTWVAGYANDVMAYIPSLRVLNEGGYEGATAMIYYGLPTKWAPPVEEMIVKEVRALATAVEKGK